MKQTLAPSRSADSVIRRSRHGLDLSRPLRSQLRLRKRSGSFSELIRLAQDGDEVAIETLYRSHVAMVHGYLRARGTRDADDIASEIFISMIRSLSRFKGNEDDFRAWLMTIAHRRLVDHRRRDQTDRNVELEQFGEMIQGAALDQPLLVDHRLIAAFEQLTTEQREVLALRFVADLSLEAVAEATGRPVGAVKSMQHRALAALRESVNSLGSSGQGLP